MPSIHKFVQQGASYLKIDRAVSYSLGTTIVSALGFFLLMLAVLRCLSPAEQGYFYTFSSLLAMQCFFELGFSQCVLQFASHEAAHLDITRTGLTSDLSCRAATRLASLYSFARQWYALAALLMFALVGVGGDLFFSFHKSVGDAEQVNWRFAWWLLCAATAGILYIQSQLSMLEGCNQMAFTWRLRFYVTFAKFAVLILFLFSGFGLISLGISSLIQLIFSIVFLWEWNLFFNSLRTLIKKLTPTAEVVHWQEIWPFQWRVAVSWTGGFFISNSFNPIILHMLGPVAAGQFGILWALLQGVTNFGFAWMNTKASEIGGLVSRRNWVALDAVWMSAARRTMSAGIFGALCVVIMIYFLQHIGAPLGARFAPWWVALITGIGIILNQAVLTQTLYVRAHKEEPFMVLHCVTGILIVIFQFILIPYMGIAGAGLACLLSMIVELAWASSLFITLRKKWHKES